MARICIAALVVACLVVATASATDNAARKLLQAEPCGPPAAKYVNDEPTSCATCASIPGTVAWCCHSEHTMSAKTCKAAGAECCAGPEFTYQATDDGHVETEQLEDVWCVPKTCKPAFTITAIPGSVTGR